MRYPGRELPERCHLFGLDQIGLGRLQLAQRRLGGVARAADLGVGAPPFAFEMVALDQTVAQHAKRFCHRADLMGACLRYLDVELAARNRRHASFQPL